MRKILLPISVPVPEEGTPIDDTSSVSSSPSRLSYDELLKNAPDHLTDAFLEYLREHNTVVYESENWLIIENYKYHTKEKAWWTAFNKSVLGADYASVWLNMTHLMKFKKFDFIIKSEERRSVRRFHVHLVEQ